MHTHTNIHDGADGNVYSNTGAAETLCTMETVLESCTTRSYADSYNDSYDYEHPNTAP